MPLMGKMIICTNCGERYFCCSDEEGTLCNSCKIKKEVFLDVRNEKNRSTFVNNGHSEFCRVVSERIRKAELALLQNGQR